MLHREMPVRTARHSSATASSLMMPKGVSWV